MENNKRQASEDKENILMTDSEQDSDDAQYDEKKLSEGKESAEGKRRRQYRGSIYIVAGIYLIWMLISGVITPLIHGTLNMALWQIAVLGVFGICGVGIILAGLRILFKNK